MTQTYMPEREVALPGGKAACETEIRRPEIRVEGRRAREATKRG